MEKNKKETIELIETNKKEEKKKKFKFYDSEGSVVRLKLYKEDEVDGKWVLKRGVSNYLTSDEMRAILNKLDKLNKDKE